MGSPNAYRSNGDFIKQSKQMKMEINNGDFINHPSGFVPGKILDPLSLLSAWPTNSKAAVPVYLRFWGTAASMLLLPLLVVL